ncbi:MAG: Phosphoglycerate kinase [archaeon]
MVKTIDDFKMYNKTVLLRADLNSEVTKGKVIFSERMKAAVATMRELHKKKAKVVVIAHQGRPQDRDFTSMKQHASYLKEYIPIRFINDLTGKKAQEAIKNLKKGELILLENVRSEKDEFHPEKKNNKLVQALAPHADLYVNDAFSVSHRNQTSITAFPKYLPHGVGRLFEQELYSLKKIHLQNSLFILGGAKPEENLALLKNKNILSCGYFCHLCLIAKGYRLGKQEDVLKKEIKDFPAVIKHIKKYLHHIQTPIDFAIQEKGKRKEISLEQLPIDKLLFDIGDRTIEQYTKEITKATSIFYKGPSGLYSDTRFMKGTKELLKAIANSKAFSVIGGGHSNEAIKRSHINKNKFDYISLSGGALIEYLAGKKLPGLEALER